jgi:ribonuclease HI
MVIFTDNQAAIRVSGQYIVRAITEKVDTLRAAGWHVLIQWIPGHEGAHGNELADAAAEAASEAATQTQVRAGVPPCAGFTNPPSLANRT